MGTQKTWTYSEPLGTVTDIQKADGGLLISAEMVNDLVRYQDMSFWSTMFRPLTWEARLAAAIEARSIRNRIRRGRMEAADGLTTAYDALRGRHRCSDDY